MINKRLVFLESNNYITQFQSCFRSDRSTTDNLVRLETFIRVAFIKREHVVAFFFFFFFGKSLLYHVVSHIILA